MHLVGASHGSEEPNGCPTMLETEETQDSVEMTERERERATRAKLVFSSEEDKEITSVILSNFWVRKQRFK